ncbi:pyrroline-5-carboxylate reductase dimerization domain-containing protein [Cypionkella sp.]|uniref:pyrroline-5-carboxylate reductase dimerization domain-containing protein n=1 Tax=Cypionkella sp. TaxID=2811411 RepID=UPI002721115A|nr:pyrroline-5-carboxylate reductase dimerization domain-containing protein [Cypionkella sp.]MDO8985071.1 pyrroline-5-carboxylate reductase dimerization domain-containing protein [Cypionkella sp.]MDP1576674.1 pyrroline-5-carboxylate reductase dimerization domain-containing protein [Cypionkella sp.]MDP2047372.1 pyrroline-5-carboxylate reductase dimerization domain-containing protein [Cypionkella sp.]
MKIGILGIGHLAEYLVRGANRAQSGGVEFVLSPRSGDKAARLAETYRCSVAESNQAVVDQCEMVLVCLPAATGLVVLEALQFRDGQSVCSAMAGASLADLTAAVAPAEAFCAMMPGFANAFSSGPSLLYPGDADWEAFLALLGPVHRFADPQAFETAAVFGAMSGASIFLLRHLVRWYERQGLDAVTARALVAETFRGNAEVLLQAEAGLDEIAVGVTTKGGITEQLVGVLEARGALAAWDEAMDGVLTRMVPGR